jgi:short-subunit dehydrogenase
VINTASTAGLQSAPSTGPYNVAKFGVVALSETLRMELAAEDSGVSVSVLCPGAINIQVAT